MWDFSGTHVWKIKSHVAVYVIPSRREISPRDGQLLWIDVFKCRDVLMDNSIV